MSAEIIFSHMAREVESFYKDSHKEIFSVIFEGNFDLENFNSQLNTENIYYLDCGNHKVESIESAIEEVITKVNEGKLYYLIINNMELLEIKDRYIFFQILSYDQWKTIEIRDQHYIIDPKSLLVFIVITKSFKTFNFAYRNKFDRFFVI